VAIWTQTAASAIDGISSISAVGVDAILEKGKAKVTWDKT